MNSIDLSGAQWRTSNYSNGQGACVEVAINWHKSSYSNGQASCVEVALTEPAVAVRDTKDREGPVLVFGRDDWRAFVGSIRNGEYDSA